MHPQARYLLTTPSSSQHPQVSSTTSEYLVLLTRGIRYLRITPRFRQPPPSTSSSSPPLRPPCNTPSSVSLPMHSTHTPTSQLCRTTSMQSESYLVITPRRATAALRRRAALLPGYHPVTWLSPLGALRPHYGGALLCVGFVGTLTGRMLVQARYNI